MALRSIQIVRGFFSDYWVGSVLSQKKSAGAKITPLQARRKLERLETLYSRVDFKEEVELTFFREKFARPLLREILGFEIIEDKTEPKIRLLSKSAASSDNAIDDRTPLAALALCTSSADLETRQTRQQLEKALLENNLGYGLILSPQALRIIRKPGEGNKGAYLDISFASLVSLGDDESLLVAYKVFASENFQSSNGVPAVISLLEAESRQHSAKVSEDLKVAVFQSAELLIQGFVHDTEERASSFTSKPALLELRDAALLTLYRLLFILYAESRDDRLQQHPLYQRSYSLETLIGELLKTPKEMLAANSISIWQRVLSLFKIFDEGLPKLPDMQNIPPRGGTLFSHSTPEGKLISSLQLPDTTAATLLLMMATTRPRKGVGRERISFRELAIEQLGSVYEGLLEHEPRIASELLILCKLAGKELALSPSELARVCREKKLNLIGEESIVGGTECSYLLAGNELDDEGEDEEEETNGDSDEDSEDDDKGIKKGAPVKLIRRVEQGTFLFIPGTSRKSSGSFYTPDEMVQYLATHSLSGLIEGKSPEEIEALRIIDIACGSGHFLVGTARVLGKALFDSYNLTLDGKPPKDFAPYEDSSGVLHDRWQIEGEAWCKRRIVERCLFGVDLNPTAVQLAQVALWIESLAGDRPLSFFAHHVRCGNSLMGTWMHRLQLNPLTGAKEMERKQQASLFDHAFQVTQGLFEKNIIELIKKAMDERLLISKELPSEIRKDSPDEYRYKADRLNAAEKIIGRVKLLFDLRSASAFIPDIWGEFTTLLGKDELESYCLKRPWWTQFQKVREREKFFHWELEFPEVFMSATKGFDVILGNPPWDKVLPAKLEFYSQYDTSIRLYTESEVGPRISELHKIHPGLGDEFRQYEERIKTIITFLRKGGDYPLSKGRTQAAHEDLAKLFLERSLQLVSQKGSIGLVLPSVVYNGDGCANLRSHIFNQLQIKRFYGFENRLKIFPIDSRYKFVCLVLLNELPFANGFDVAFMRHDVGELQSDEAKNWVIRVTPDELRSYSPESFAFLEYRSSEDQRILSKMYRGTKLLADKGGDSWGAELFTDFAHAFVYNATRDKDLWSDKNTRRPIAPKDILSIVPSDQGALVNAMREKGFVPVYEGKHIEQFIVGTKPFRWWLSVGAAATKYGTEPITSPVLVFRETASNTNQRTCIAAVLPAHSAASHKLSGILVNNVHVDSAATVLNSFCFDFALRLRTAGTNISFTYIRPMPVPTASVTERLPRFVTVEAWGKQSLNYITDNQDYWENLWDSNKAVAEAYGLNAFDFLHILGSFPTLARKRPEFYSFLIAKARTWAGVRNEDPKSEYLNTNL
jgi:hypothetical protein